MRIVLIAGEYGLAQGAGGISTYVHIVARALARLGNEVHVVTGTPGADTSYRDGQVYVHAVGLPRVVHWMLRANSKVIPQTGYIIARSRAVVRMLRTLHERAPIDIVEGMDWMADGWCASSAIRRPSIVRLNGPSFAIRKHNLSVRPSLDQRFVELIERHHIRRADLISSTSRFVGRVVTDEYGDASLEDRMVVVPNPVDVDMWGTSSRTESRQPTVTYVGRLEHLKGVDVLFRAIKYLFAEFRECRFRFIGTDTHTAPGGESMTAFGRRMLADLGDRAQFLGPRPREALVDYYAESWVVVTPSRYESFGYACAEAMAAGVAVVASQAGAFPELITDRESGLLAPPEDPVALADRIGLLLSDAVLRRRIGRRARDVARERWDSPVVARRLLSEYSALLGRCE